MICSPVADNLMTKLHGHSLVRSGAYAGYSGAMLIVVLKGSV